MNAAATENKPKIPWVFIGKVILVIIIIALHINFEYDIEKRKLLAQFLRGLYSFLIPSIVLSMFRFLVIMLYNARDSQKRERGNFVLGINRLTAVLNTVFFVIAIMTAFGINPKDFITSITIVAMAIAVIFKDYITNMISGLIVMFSEQLSVGDRIKVGEHKGRIIDITFANLVLQDEEDDIVMVPNNLVFTATFMNLSAHQSSLFTVKFELPLEVSLHIEELEEHLRLSLTTHPNLEIKEDEFQVKVLELGKDFVRYKLDLYAVTNSNRMHRNIENEILKEIIKFERNILKSS
ncbi:MULTISPECIES: mechanosensitive ion channel family protein [Sphingobacterium]|uniref:mechanosensitive ion channel family protein n=1 Tax=Sphingobacterium TaxID=28453 RepID=UPI00162AD3D9|nr:MULTISPECIES: mechanosensitive ion channel domain-containing protein [Sphingobacterium]